MLKPTLAQLPAGGNSSGTGVPRQMLEPTLAQLPAGGNSGGTGVPRQMLEPQNQMIVCRAVVQALLYNHSLSPVNYTVIVFDTGTLFMHQQHVSYSFVHFFDRALNTKGYRTFLAFLKSSVHCLAAYLVYFLSIILF
jgi:hypothetical protein